MATNVMFYTEGGIPSNFQTHGVRNTKVYDTSDQVTLVAGDLYRLFDLQTNEVVQQFGVYVHGDSVSTGTAAITLNGAAIASLALVDLDTEGMTAGLLSELPNGGFGDGGTVEVTFTGDPTGAKFVVFAVVANVNSPETFTQVDTPAP